MYVCNLILLASNAREPCKRGASMYAPNTFKTSITNRNMRLRDPAQSHIAVRWRPLARFASREGQPIEFRKLIGVNARTPENWEQHRMRPT